ncbi:MAG: RecX family transcriptional regulator [Acidobacteriota bacterium]|nr:MAG: RecX family transcriptional regulator [Acidobacteriota bacterium]
MRRRFPAGEVSPALDRLEELGYLNDADFAELRARSLRVTRLWGSRRIELDLKRLGVNAKIARLTVEKLEQEHPEREALLRAVGAWIRTSGHPETASQLKKLYDYCLRRGFSPQMTRDELEEYFSEVDWS